MKRIMQVLLISFSLVSAIPNNTLRAQDVDINVFYNTLTPYGRWIDYGSYGQVWICNTPGFIPYETAGYWAYTDYGWTWLSDYSWGWAPFHYGRWAYTNEYGWIWVPGYEWAPAWVCWRSSGDYYGWAPLAPGMSISVTVIPANRWCFVPVRYITSPQIHNYYVNRSQNVAIINKTTVINNTSVYNNARYVSGPHRADVERSVGRPVTTMHVSNASRPVTTNITHNTVNIYRPVIRNNSHTAPSSNHVNVTPNSPNINRPANVTSPNNVNHERPVTNNASHPASVDHNRNHMPSNNEVHTNRNPVPEHVNPAAPTNRPQNMNHPAPQPMQHEMHQQPQSMHQPEMHQQPQHQPQPQQPMHEQRPQPQPMPHMQPQPQQMPHAQPQPMPHQQEERPHH